jgi:hypothetical protein
MRLKVEAGFDIDWSVYEKKPGAKPGFHLLLVERCC